MKLRTSLAVSALALAVAPVAARAQQQVVFSDTFDAGTSASRYDLFHVDNDADLEVMDTSANFAFDYGAFTYKRTDPVSGEVAFAPIPSAPNSGGTTTGLRFSVNDLEPIGTAIINAYPKATEFLGGAVPSGDYSLKFDMWMNYNGFKEGGTGSTQYMVAGIKQQAEGIGGPVIGAGPFPTQTGYAMAVAGERGNNNAYRLYKDNDRLTDFAAAGYVAQPETQGTTTFNPDNGRNSFYQTLFPEPQYETGGAPGKNWVTVEISHIDGQLTYKMNGTTIATRQDTSLESGNILLGYADFATSIAVPPEDNFVIFDNVVVTSFAAPKPPRWKADADGAWSNAANWEGGIPNGVGAAANFLDDITAPRTIDHDTRTTAGSLLFDSPHAYTITGTFGLTLQSSPGEPVRISVLRGSHTVSTSTILSSDAAVNIAQGGRLTIDSLAGVAKDITKTGGGTVEAQRVVADQLNIDEGTVAITRGVGNTSWAQARELNIAGATDAWTATFDLGDSVMAITPDAATREAVLRRTLNQVKSARNATAGRWKGTGITSSAAEADALTTIAVLLNDRGDGTPIFTSLAARQVDANAVLLKHTWNGDANLDGRVNADDYFRIDQGFLAQPANPTYAQGDFNYDGRVNADDYFLIDQAFLGQTGTLGGGLLAVAVPEPGTVALFLGAALACLTRSRRRR